MGNDLKEIENYFELTGGSSYWGFELPGVDYIYLVHNQEKRFWESLLNVECLILILNKF